MQFFLSEEYVEVFIKSFEICILTSLGLFEFMKVAALLEALESHLFIQLQQDDISQNHDRQEENILIITDTEYKNIPPAISVLLGGDQLTPYKPSFPRFNLLNQDIDLNLN